MRRAVSSLLSLNNLRKFCGNAAVFKFAKNNFKLEIIDQPKKGKVLVLAPHPDDDVFGCGGTIALHTKQGDQVKVVYFAGNVADEIKNLKFKIKNDGRGSIDRRAEAEEAAKILKVAEVEFWGLVDNKFAADEQNVARLKNVINEYRPDLIYCPSFTDAHPDHYEVAKMLYKVMRNEKCEMSESAIIQLYEIWTPIFANRLVKIDNVIESKKAAIKCHSSQLSDRFYSDAIIGLNQYRAGMFNAGSFAEAFTEMDSELYIKMFEKFRLT